MEPSKRALRASRYVEEIEELLKYYVGEEKYYHLELNSDEKIKKLSEKVQFIHDTLEDLSTERKLHDIRLWKYFKRIIKSRDKKCTKKSNK